MALFSFAKPNLPRFLAQSEVEVGVGKNCMHFCHNRIAAGLNFGQNFKFNMVKFVEKIWGGRGENSFVTQYDLIYSMTCCQI